MIFFGFAENSIQLVPDGTLFLHIIIILGMVWALNRTLFKPINRILEERERRTRGRSSEAHEILKRVEKSMANYERALREARAEGYRLMEQERAEALRERQIRMSTIREVIDRSIAEQKEMLRTQAEDARRTLEVDARRIATEISAHILRRPISDTAATGLGLQV